MKTTHIEHVFFHSEHLVLVHDLYTQAILQRANDLAQPLDGAHVYDPCGGTYKPHGCDVVLQLRWVYAHKCVVHEP